MKGNYFFCVFVVLCILLSNTVQAQSYIDFSTYSGGTDYDEPLAMKVVNGETYLVNKTQSANFPITDGSTYKGATDLIISKYSIDGSLLYATYLGGNGDDLFSQIIIINGEIYLTGTTNSTNYPVTNSAHFNGTQDIFVTKLNTNGGIIFSTYVGGSNLEQLAQINCMDVAGNEVFIAGETLSQDFPVTEMTNNSNSGDYKGFVTKLNSINGAITNSRLIGGAGYTYMDAMYVQNGSVFLIGYTSSTEIPVTLGNIADFTR